MFKLYINDTSSFFNLDQVFYIHHILYVLSVVYIGMYSMLHEYNLQLLNLNTFLYFI